MTVARDAVLEFATFTTTTPATLSFTPTGTARGVSVFIFNGGTNDVITGVTYGGVAMERVGWVPLAGAEGGGVFAYHLGSGIPTGTQTVSIAHTGAATNKWAIVQSVTAAADTEPGSVQNRQGGSVANPTLHMDTGPVEALRVGILSSGLDAITSLTPLSGMEALTTANSHDFGTQVVVLAQQTTASTEAFDLGFTSAADDVDFLGFSIQEVVTDGFPKTTAPMATLFDTAATAHLVNMPTVVDTGDLLLMVFASGTTPHTTPSGWAILDDLTTNFEQLIYWKIADGTEGDTTVDVVTSGAVRAAALVHRIRAGTWDSATDPEVGTGTTGSSSTPDAPSVTPSWGAADTLWIAVWTLIFDGLVFPTAFPDDFTNSSVAQTFGTQASWAASMYRKINAASQDPGTVTSSSGGFWHGQTIAIRPADTGMTGTIAATQDPNVAAFTGTVTSNDATGVLAATQAPNVAAFSGTVVNPVPSNVTVNGQTVTITGNQGTVTILDSLLNVVYSGGAAVITLPPDSYTWTSTDGPSGAFTVAASANRMGDTGAIRKPPRSFAPSGA